MLEHERIAEFAEREEIAEVRNTDTTEVAEVCRTKHGRPMRSDMRKRAEPIHDERNGQGANSELRKHKRDAAMLRGLTKYEMRDTVEQRVKH